MATERLSMRKTREILRQKWELGRTHQLQATSENTGTILSAEEHFRPNGDADPGVDEEVRLGLAGGRP